MEHEFDKEIDAILRKAHRDGPVLVGDVVASRHLDADEISAFAENAMPANSRALYSAHMADCDRCRKILSDVLVMNAEAAPVAASPSVITIAERAMPWYRRMFAYPNLAFVMGGLVLVFGGFLALTIINRSGMNDGAIVSQMNEPQTAASGPNAEQYEPYDSGDVSNRAMSANAAANTMQAASNSNSIGGGGGGGRRDIGSANSAANSAAENSFTVDGLDAAAPAPPPASATGSAIQPALREAPVRGRDDLAKTEDKVKVATAPQEQSKADNVSKDRNVSIPAQSGPMKNNDLQYNRQLEKMDRKPAAKGASEERDEGGGRRTVAGKTFERKQGVWYDTTYQGRPTINVRRGTDEFKRLDAGLRSIASSFNGTVVVVWGSKSYRVQ